MLGASASPRSQLRGSDQLVPLPFDLAPAGTFFFLDFRNLPPASPTHQPCIEKGMRVLKLHTKEKLFKQAHNVFIEHAGELCIIILRRKSKHIMLEIEIQLTAKPFLK